MKLTKYEKRFVRMMAQTFGLIVALIIIMVIIKLPTRTITITSIILLFIGYMVKRVYWSRLNGLELREKMDKICRVP